MPDAHPTARLAPLELGRCRPHSTCSTPAQWTDAHHVTHWLHGGTTCLGNLALLCRRHHGYVHDKDLTATITDTGVTWHTWQHWRTSVRC